MSNSKVTGLRPLEFLSFLETNQIFFFLAQHYGSHSREGFGLLADQAFNIKLYFCL